MNPEQLTSYALNELPPDERAALEAQMQNDPALRQEAEEMKSFCLMLQHEVSGDADEALQPEQRAKLMQEFQAAPKIIRPLWRRPSFLGGLSLAAAACVAVMLSIHGLQVDAPSQEKPATTEKGDENKATPGNKKIAERENEDLSTLVAVRAKEQRPAAPAPLPAAAASPALSMPNPIVASQHPVTMTLPNSPQSGIATGQPATGTTVSAIITKAGTGTLSLDSSNTFTGGTTNTAGRMVISGTTAETPKDRAFGLNPSGTTFGTGTVALATDAPTRTLAPQPAPSSSYEGHFAISDSPSVPASPSADTGDERMVRLGEQRASYLSRSTATYRPIIENPFEFAAQQPLSTFSLDVDTASYANVRRFLNAGQRPPPDAVRLEELINYFPYHYEGPKDDKPVAVHVDLADAPWQPLHRIARIAVKARELKGERAAANFVFLIDVSGSMSPQERLPLIQKSLELLVDQLREDDRVAIVTYAGESGVALESTTGAQKEKITQAIEKLRAGGSTNGASGIRMAYEQAALNFDKNKINRVILCTDGDFNVGTSSVQELEKLIAEEAKSGVLLTALGVGTDNLHDHTMQALADRGNGNYHYLDSLAEARKVLVEQMTGTLVTVAKDVKVQVEFNPAQVAAYRLIGYEKRLLAKEDFNNDKKDAGEVGAGHTVTVLYEIVPASVKYPDGKPLVDELKYAKVPALKNTPAAEAPAAAAAPQSAIQNPKSEISETMTVKVRYKEPDADTSKLFEVPVTDAHKILSETDKDFQFAVSVAGFGMLLRGSPNVGGMNWEAVRKLALSGKGTDEEGWRGEFIQLIEKARGICGEQH